MSIEEMYDELIGIIKEGEVSCKGLVELGRKAERKVGEIDDYVARLVAGEIHHSVNILELFAYDKERVGSIPYID